MQITIRVRVEFSKRVIDQVVMRFVRAATYLLPQLYFSVGHAARKNKHRDKLSFITLRKGRRKFNNVCSINF